MPSLQLSHLPWGTRPSACCSSAPERGLRAEASPSLGGFDFEAAFWGRQGLSIVWDRSAAAAWEELAPGDQMVGGWTRTGRQSLLMSCRWGSWRGMDKTCQPLLQLPSCPCWDEEPPGGGGEPCYARSQGGCEEAGLLPSPPGWMCQLPEGVWVLPRIRPMLAEHSKPPEWRRPLSS